MRLVAAWEFCGVVLEFGCVTCVWVAVCCRFDSLILCVAVPVGWVD